MVQAEVFTRAIILVRLESGIEMDAIANGDAAEVKLSDGDIAIIKKCGAASVRVVKGL